MESAKPTIVIEPSSPTDADAARLIAELNEVLTGLYQPDANHFSLDPADVSGNRGVFCLVRQAGVAQGCGAIRLLEDGRGEIKRMYVRPAARGKGLGRMLLDHLQSEARRLGATGLVLEMGDNQPHADALYRSFGLAEIPCWGEYRATPTSVCLGKDL